MDWFNSPDPKKRKHPDKISIRECCEIIYNNNKALREEKEREAYERLKIQRERAQARNEYLENKYGGKFTSAEIEELERAFRVKIAEVQEKEMKELRKKNEEERQLRNDVLR